MLREEFIRFYEENYGYRVFAEIFVTNKYGAAVAQTAKTSDYRQDDEQWWQAAKERGLYTGNVEYDKSSEEYGIPIGVRIDDSEGNFIGVIKGLFSATEIIKESEIAIKKIRNHRRKTDHREGEVDVLFQSLQVPGGCIRQGVFYKDTG
ncbi:MAG: hypothetical protein ACOC7U_02940 [Spirochaetota bacterium]